jgi:TRAP-type C4-dicarboxylate transport system permease small subunit
MITVLLIVFAAAVGAVSGGWSAALLDHSSRTPVTDATLGVIGFVLVFYAQLHWMGAPFVLIPLSLKSLLGTLLLPVVHQVVRPRFSK